MDYWRYWLALHAYADKGGAPVAVMHMLPLTGAGPA